MLPNAQALDNENQPEKQNVSMIGLLRIPAIMVSCLATFMGSVAWSIMDPTLAPHFEVVNMKVFVIMLRVVQFPQFILSYGISKEKNQDDV